MLIKLIEEIRKGGTQKPTVLAERLGVSPAMVMAMLADLERRGILQRLDTDCDGAAGCSACSLSDACTPRSHGGATQTWVLK